MKYTLKSFGKLIGQIGMLLLLILSCNKKLEFNNPVDPQVIAAVEKATAEATEQVLVAGGFTIDSDTLPDFYIGKYEVTQKFWREIVQWKQGSATSPLKLNPSNFTGDNLPVVGVSWYNIQTWLGYLNEKVKITDSKKNFRLPTKAEWQYAAQGGTHWTDYYTYSGSNTINNVAWYSDNSNGGTHNVGAKIANQLGIYDMSGNVSEWINDTLLAYRYMCGGSYSFPADGCTVFSSEIDDPANTWTNVGFRIARSE